jgi:hypothetical protein
MSHSLNRSHLTRWLALAFALALALLAQPALAAIFPVNTQLDGVDNDLTDNLCISDVVAGGACTLRAAIQQANFTPGPDFITLPPGDYELTIENPGGIPEDASVSGDLDITSNVVVSGTNAATTIIRGDDSGWEDRIFHLDDDGDGDTVVRISRVTVRDGNVEDEGGGILSQGGSLELREVTVRSNQSGDSGGGLYFIGVETLTIERSTIYSNTATGGASSRGGGIYIGQNADANVYNTTVSDNVADSQGGGIEVANNSQEIVLNNVTVYGNRLLASDDGGAGLFIGNSNETDVSNSILAGNFATSGGNPVANDCRGQFNSLVYTLIQAQPANCVVSAVGANTGNLTGQNPLLGPLANNRGQTPTHALLAGSPALDTANPATVGSAPACQPTDQRGVTRPGGSRCDMGAYEKQPLVYLPLVDE